MPVCLKRSLLILVLPSLLLLSVSSCKTPSRGGSDKGGSGLLETAEDFIKLRELQYEVDGTVLKTLAARVGCRQASE